MESTSTTADFGLAYATYCRMYDRLASGRQPHEIGVGEFQTLDWDLQASTGWSVKRLVEARRLQRQAA